MLDNGESGVSKRQSIEPTYDSAETGYRYHVTTTVGDRTIAFQQPIPDPFVNTTIKVGWWDALRSLLVRGHVEASVVVGADSSVVEDVLELDDQYLGANCTRRDEWNVVLGASLATFGESLGDE